jgi:hypothetical protein
MDISRTSTTSYFHVALLGILAASGCAALDLQSPARQTPSVSHQEPPRPSSPSEPPSPRDQVVAESERALDGATARHDVQLASDWELWNEWNLEERQFALTRITRLPPVAREQITFRDLVEEQIHGVHVDHIEFYSRAGLTWLTAGFATGALMANTGFDEHAIRHKYLENIVQIPNDELFEKIHQPKFLGDGLYTIPAFAVAALAEPLIDDLPLGSETAEWGQRSLRTILVGGPPLLGLQLLTGGSRPGETTAKSKWKPFQDENGVSGHSFMGAIPFMSGAKMTHNLWLKAGLYTASTLPALSRVNDDDHYFSQVFLGWWLAYIAATAVDHAHNPEAHYEFFAYPHPEGLGVGLEYRL